MQKSFHADKPSDIVLTGIGMISASGRNYAANRAAFDQPTTRHSHSDYQVLNFNPAPYLTDRKVVKSVSSRDVLGLVAFEECIKEAGVHPSANAVMNPERVGLYVGAPPSATTDNANYQEAIAQSSTSAGKLVEADFGLNFRSANPTTLLAGLPNNVLCYGAKTLDARGPNSNYTALEVSGHLAVIGAVRAMRLGRLGCWG